MRNVKRIKLSEADSKLLAVIEHRAAQPFSAVARLMKTKEYNVRYRFHGLQQRSVILERVPFVDMYRLGFTVFKIYCGLTSEHQVAKSKLIPYLLRLPRVLWLAQLGGEFQLVFSVSCRRAADIYKLQLEMAEKFGPLFSHSQLVVQLLFTSFGRRYLAPQLKPGPVLTFGDQDLEPITIDELDHAILAALCRGEICSDSRLAQSLDVPLSTLLRRIKNLESKKVIRGHIYRMDTTNLGLHRYNFLVSAKSVSSSLSQEMRVFCAKNPQIVNFGQTIGAWDYEIAADVEAPYEAVHIVRTLGECFGSSISDIKSVPVFKSYKYVSYA